MSSAIKFSCKTCENNVTNCDQATHCDLCDSWVHIKCRDPNHINYKFLQSSNDPWIFSHAAVKLSLLILRKISSIFYDSNNKSKKPDDKDGSLLLKPSEHLKYSVNQFNNMSSPPDHINSDDSENTISSKYHDIDELQNLKITRVSHFP